MKFGRIALEEAEGAVVVHSVRLPGLDLRKGAVLTPALIAQLRAAGVADIVATRLEAGDVGENDAATAIGAAIAGAHAVPDAAFTGRVNLRAGATGVLVVDRAGVDALNRIDEAVTLATLPAYRTVATGEMIATVKIIPFAVPGAVMEALGPLCRPLIEVAPYRIRRVAVISTLLPGLQEKVVAKTLRTTAARLAPAGAAIIGERRVRHDEAEVARALAEVAADGAELALVFGASAIADRRDVIPAGIEAAGGVVEHFGMPVDPGNLLLVGRVGGMPVLGAPGCARSPRENGFDWVLHRLLAGLAVSREDVTSMGVGGLLMEIPTRPQPREGAVSDTTSKRAAVVLAAGRGTRMPEAHKLSVPVEGEPLVRRAVKAALASSARPVVVVTGHEADKVRAALTGLDIVFVHNPDYAEGLSTSLRTGIAALPGDVEAAVVMLGDMPMVGGELVERLARAIDVEAGQLIAVPVVEGRRGNPVAWARRMFPALMALSGDIGARHLIAQYPDAVVEVATQGDGAFLDIDTRDELAALAIHEIAAHADVDEGPALDGMKAEDA
ncbi:NTP transferase domain-containing protein [Ancylobacter sp. VNQ12]|uniref:NTP transferase domain-containing protein n=1 Tax=Ancylobacter sp. VNQ12 TaxID=3400920 RepID=UPI003C004FE4